MCVCVCVCERERERKRESISISVEGQDALPYCGAVEGSDRGMRLIGLRFQEVYRVSEVNRV